MRPHSITFSLIKAIGMVAVVIGHASIGTPLFTFVYLFHIAVFFFAAGYFFNDTPTAQPGLRAPLRFIGHKLRRLYLPYVVFGLLFVLLHNTLLRAHIIAYDFNLHTPIPPYDTHEMFYRMLRVVLFSWYEQPLVPLWFLFGMFTSLAGFYAVTWCCHRLSPRHSERLRAAVIALLTLGGSLWLAHPFGIPGEPLACRSILLLPLLYLGRLYALFESRIPLRTSIAALCLVGLTVAAGFGYQVNIGGLIFGNPLLFAAVTIAGCYMVLTFAHALAAHDNAFVRGLDRIGRSTMPIMLLHLTSFKLVSLLQIGIYDYPIRFLAFHPVIPYHIWLWWLPYTVMGIALPMTAAWLWDRLRPRCY